VDDVPELTDEEEAGIHAAIESAAKARVDRILGR
jgi:hypothetical protein